MYNEIMRHLKAVNLCSFTISIFVSQNFNLEKQKTGGVT